MGPFQGLNASLIEIKWVLSEKSGSLLGINGVLSCDKFGSFWGLKEPILWLKGVLSVDKESNLEIKRVLYGDIGGPV